MNFSVIIPDRGDRPVLLKNCLRMIEAQTVKPFEIKIINFPPTDNEVDITKRYRTGYNSVSKECEVVFLIENDDWYHSRFFEIMLLNWEKNEKPEIFGPNYTYYYHIFKHKYVKWDHPHRCSAMSTLIKAHMDLKWPVDNEPYTDMWLWTRCGLTKLTFDPGQIITVGIKHGIGKGGGEFHNTRMDLYTNEDKNLEWLKKHLDDESFNFYTHIKTNENNTITP